MQLVSISISLHLIKSNYDHNEEIENIHYI